jgi:hypothetical protein
MKQEETFLRENRGGGREERKERETEKTREKLPNPPTGVQLELPEGLQGLLREGPTGH